MKAKTIIFLVMMKNLISKLIHILGLLPYSKQTYTYSAFNTRKRLLVCLRFVRKSPDVALSTVADDDKDEH